MAKAQRQQWGDNFTLIAASGLLQRTILVCSLSPARELMKQEINPPPYWSALEGSLAPVILSHISDYHYLPVSVRRDGPWAWVLDPGLRDDRDVYRRMEIDNQQGECSSGQDPMSSRNFPPLQRRSDQQKEKGTEGHEFRRWGKVERDQETWQSMENKVPTTTSRSSFYQRRLSGMREALRGFDSGCPNTYGADAVVGLLMGRTDNEERLWWLGSQTVMKAEEEEGWRTAFGIGIRKNWRKINDDGTGDLTDGPTGGPTSYSGRWRRRLEGKTDEGGGGERGEEGEGR